MEMENKKKSKGLIVTIVILLILLLVSVGYICYSKGIIDLNGKTDQKDKHEKVVSKKEDLKYEGNLIVDAGNVKNKAGEKYYSLIIKVNGKWYEVANNSQSYNVFGEYDKKLYYADDFGFKYIDLSSKDFNVTEWIKYEEKCYDDDNGFVGLAYADKGILKDDTIYFIKSSFGWDNNRDSYLYTLNVNATSYSDIKKEFKQKSIVDFIIADNYIYYYYWEGSDIARKSLKSYNFDTKETKKLLNNIDNIDLYKDDKKVIYSQAVSNKDDAPDKWYLYDLESNDKTFIAKVNSSSDSDCVSGMFQLFNNKVYYVDRNVIMRYENGKKEKIYKLDNINYGGQGGYVEVINDNLFDYSSLSNDKYGYILNGKKVTKDEVQQYLKKYNVYMMNGKDKVFDDSQIVE